MKSKEIKDIKKKLTCLNENQEGDIEKLEELINRLSKRVKKIVKKNGFSKKLKEKATLEL